MYIVMIPWFTSLATIFLCLPQKPQELARQVLEAPKTNRYGYAIVAIKRRPESLQISNHKAFLILWVVVVARSFQIL